MPVKCAIYMCDSTINKNKITFFKFPMNVPSILQQWIKAVNRENWTPTLSSRVCQLHFKSTDFSNNSGKILRLKPDTIPTQNLHNKSFKNNMQVCADSNIETQALQADFDICNIDSTKVTTNTYNTISNVQAEKRKAVEPLERPNIKCLKLEEENKKLKDIIKSLTQSYEEKLNNQADTFRILMEKERNALKEKLNTKINRVNHLQKKMNEKQSKLETVLEELNISKTLSNGAYEILRSDMSIVSSQLFENECKNRKKEKGRRYSDDVNNCKL